MSKEKLSFDEANDFVNQRAEELKTQYGTDIVPLLFNFNDEWVYGWFKTPTRFQCMDVMGRMGEQPLFSGEKILTANLLKESDKKLLDPSPLYDEINCGAYLEAYKASNRLNVNLAEKKTGK